MLGDWMMWITVFWKATTNAIWSDSLEDIAKHRVYVPARFCLSGSSSASPCSRRIWKSISENCQLVLVASFHSDFLLTCPEMLESDWGLQILDQWLFAHHPTGHKALKGQENEMEAPQECDLAFIHSWVWPVSGPRSGRNHYIWVSQSSCSLNLAKKYKLRCSQIVFSA